MKSFLENFSEKLHFRYYFYNAVFNSYFIKHTNSCELKFFKTQKIVNRNFIKHTETCELKFYETHRKLQIKML